MEMKKVVRKLVSQYSRGNMHLQRGRYVTQKKLDEMKKRVSRYKFA